jgi:hypothetical protein
MKPTDSTRRSIKKEDQIRACLPYIHGEENKQHFLELMEEKGVDVQLSKMSDIKKERRVHTEGAGNTYRVCMSRKGRDRSICFTFSNSISNTVNGIDPSLYDILASIKLKKAACEGDFYKFCKDLGYDPSTKRDYKTYQKTSKILDNLKAIFDENEISVFPSFNIQDNNRIDLGIYKPIKRHIKES